MIPTVLACWLAAFHCQASYDLPKVRTLSECLIEIEAIDRKLRKASMRVIQGTCTAVEEG